MTSSLANTSAAERQPIRPPVIRLDPRQQRILASVIEAAQRKPGGHLFTDRHGFSYGAQRDWRGKTRWSIRDQYKFIIASGVTS
jgi:hypothetical protein